MSRIIFPLEMHMEGPKVADLQDALQLLLDRAAILTHDPATRSALFGALPPERSENIYEEATCTLVTICQEEWRLEIQ